MTRSGQDPLVDLAAGLFILTEPDRAAARRAQREATRLQGEALRRDRGGGPTVSNQTYLASANQDVPRPIATTKGWWRFAWWLMLLVGLPVSLGISTDHTLRADGAVALSPTLWVWCLVAFVGVWVLAHASRKRYEIYAIVARQMREWHLHLADAGPAAAQEADIAVDTWRAGWKQDPSRFWDLPVVAVHGQSEREVFGESFVPSEGFESCMSRYHTKVVEHRDGIDVWYRGERIARTGPEPSDALALLRDRLRADGAVPDCALFTPATGEVTPIALDLVTDQVLLDLRRIQPS